MPKFKVEYDGFWQMKGGPAGNAWITVDVEADTEVEATDMAVAIMKDIIKDDNNFSVDEVTDEEDSDEN